MAMASAGLGKELDCSICLTLYTDPVTLRCGHNFCRGCIHHMLKIQDGSRVYSCPECREEFQERPTLKRNITLCYVVENVRSTHLPQEEITGIRCTYCVDSPVPAVLACLYCEAFLCDKHLIDHMKEAEHLLTGPSTSPENKICSVHNETLEYYCTDDDASICVSCNLAGEHQGHQVEPLVEASKKKKKNHLRSVLMKLIRKGKKNEEIIQSLEELRITAQEKTSGEAEHVTSIFTDIRKRVDDLEKKVLSEMSRREEQLSLSHMIQKLELKKDELSRKTRHIEELCNMKDPLTVLQDPDTGDLCDPEEEGRDEDTGGHDGGDEHMVGHGAVRGAKLISHISHTLSDIIRDINMIFYVQDPADILLDVNTAANNLLISDDLKTATGTRIRQNRPETAKRFLYNEVMSRRGFISGQHYWDVEISSSKLWSVGMCYPSIDRKGHDSLIGDNDKSWCLCGGEGYDTPYSVMHNRNEILLPQPISSDGIRIYLDYEAGQLSFYELSGPIRHLHTFTATFTEPIHALLCVHDGFLKLSGRSR